MAKEDFPRSAADLMPLRKIAEQPNASPEDRWLADGLAALYGDEPANAPSESAAGWDRLQAQALRFAGRRRRGYLLKELLSSVLPRPMRILAAAGLVLALLLQPADRSPPPAPVVPIAMLNAPRVTLAEQTRSVRLLVGAKVEMEQGSVEIEQSVLTETRLLLRTGLVRLEVPPLPPRGRLVVSTSDAEVIVHGTRFTVRKVDDGSTSVAVDDGLVEVRPRGGGRPPVFLRPGEQLTVLSLARYRDELATRAGQIIDAGTCEDPGQLVDKYLALAPEGTDVSPAQYLKGFCAAQRRDVDEALRWFERAAATSRDVVRADNALARVAKLRAERSEPEGAAAWRRYLERFPSGMHRGSAQRFLSAAQP